MTTVYLLNQRFRYEYSRPIEDLRHRLMVIPPRRHGDQQRLSYRLEVRGASHARAERLDGYGNHRYEVRSGCVETAIEFESWVTVERAAEAWSVPLPGSALTDARLRRSTVLTRADEALTAAAAELGAHRGVRATKAGRRPPLELAESITTWVYGAMRYGAGPTHVQTTAAQAFALGAGVCQDYAHVMLAVARSCGLAARYVSGHLVGEAGSHAWVEVMIPDEAAPGLARAVAFDPTNDRRAGDTYVTVAVGRDYHDVAPTSGTFRSEAAGGLSSSKRLEACGRDLTLALA